MCARGLRTRWRGNDLGKDAVMKHHKPVTKRPQLSQSNLQVWKDFLIELERQIIEFIFQNTN